MSTSVIGFRRDGRPIHLIRGAAPVELTGEQLDERIAGLERHLADPSSIEGWSERRLASLRDDIEESYEDWQRGLQQRSGTQLLRGEQKRQEQYAKAIDLSAAVHMAGNAQRDADERRRDAIPGLGRATVDRPSSGGARRGQLLTRADSFAKHVRGRNLGRWDQRDEGLSIGRYVRGLLTGNWTDADAEMRAMAEGTVAGGGALVPTPLASEVIDLARNKARVIEAGAQTVLLESNIEYIGRQISDPTVSWRFENALIDESEPTFERVQFTAQSLACYCKLSWELVEDATNLDQIVKDALSSAIGLELDRVSLRGTGVAPQPRGVLNQTGVTVTSLGANGAVPTWDNLSLAAQTIRQANGEPTAFIHAPRTDGELARTKDLQGRYLAPPSDIAGIPRLATNQVPANLTQGTAGTASEIYCAQWSDLLIGMRHELTIQTLKERFADYGQIAFLAFLRADIQLAHPAHFNVLTGAL